MMTLKHSGWIMLIFLGWTVPAFSQERMAPLRSNLMLTSTPDNSVLSAKKTTSLGLPFFEDFTNYSLYPDNSRWIDSQVYINNTMCVNPVSRGVATFDALNQRGRPYDTVNRFSQRYADSLTSQPFDLGTYSPADNIYLSFFYQPQGNGFSPEEADSFQLYFHRKQGGWTQVWAVPGSEIENFKQIILPVTDTNFLYDGFQFRFVNKASINTNDDNWNLDYVRMAANRSPADTAIRDLAFTTDPTFYLNDYTAMPYRQFLANPAAERAANQSDTIWNHYGTNGTVTYGYNAIEATSGIPLGNGGNTTNIPLYSKFKGSFPTYNTLVTPPSSTSRIVYRNKYFLQSGNPTEPKDNDSILRDQVFDNYLAYDDGTAEKSYFLNLAQSLPGKIMVEYHLNAPDTLRGVAIYFGQQVPSAANKEFSVAAYSKLAGISGANSDVKLFQQDQLLPLFTDEINHFTIYKFDSPVQLPAGVFYLGTVQPASSGSDSLYIGLDVNRVGGNHLYFNVSGAWQPSLFSGAVMIRPLLGGPVTGTAVHDATNTTKLWSVFPNPATSLIELTLDQPSLQYVITDVQGRTILEGTCTNNSIAISSLSPGLYLLRIRQREGWSLPRKFIKQ